ncbi:MAG: 23S rRNA (adenine(2503)-C(2))-methyltransferase RlmN [Oligoflexia bacterium]|nr:23S rRNA (adenine(2503)-C(2))-methyltransferase RlmN [Oligoflexia bacterium]
MIYFQSLTKEELAELLRPVSLPKARRRYVPEGAAASAEEAGPSTEDLLKAERRARYRAQQIFHWVYQRFVTNWDEMSDLSKDLRVWLKENVEIYRVTERASQQAVDGTHKFLWNLADGKTVESVIIPAALQEKENPEQDFDQQRFSGAAIEDKDLKSERWSRLTACISSQVGCAMGCKFCLTGIQGLDRQLQAHEIVGQVFELRRLAPITNIVFMGMGEPLHNFENVVKACKILLDPDGLNFSKRKVTVSTSGLVPAIEELGRQADVSLAISLNASTDEQRSQIMPVNRKWNLDALMSACRSYPLGSHRRITFEYVLLKDFNDSLEDAARVLRLLRGIPSKLNLIPFNEHSGSEFKRPSDETVKKFQRYFVDRNITATVRISRGRDILAACGQLRSIFGTARGTERHRDWKSNSGAGGGTAF